MNWKILYKNNIEITRDNYSLHFDPFDDMIDIIIAAKEKRCELSYVDENGVIWNKGLSEEENNYKKTRYSFF